LRWNIFSADQYRELVNQGLGPRLGALGYERDYQQFLKDGGLCPAIPP
jgi:hypothetical protein